MAWLVCFVDDGHSVRVLEGMAINAIVARIQSTLQEPSIVSTLEAAIMDGVEISVPMKKLSCLAAPEGISLVDGLVMELFVLVQSRQMRALGVFA